jgi:hypothetical protein
MVNQRGVGVKKSKRANPVQRVEELLAHRQGDGDAGSFRQGGGALLVLDANRPSRVYPRTYLVVHAAPLYDDGLTPTQCVRDADDGLESIALCAARGAVVGTLVRDADVVVQHLRHDFRRDAAAVVGDAHAYLSIIGGDVAVDLHGDVWCNAGHLTAVEGVIHELFQDDGGEGLRLLAG